MVTPSLTFLQRETQALSTFKHTLYAKTLRTKLGARSTVRRQGWSLADCLQGAYSPSPGCFQALHG